MDSETKQELLTIALLMKKARMQEEVDRKEALDKMEEENCFVNEEELRLEMQDEADRLVRQQLSFGFSKFEDMVHHVAMKQPDEYKRLKPLLRRTWNFWCRDPEEEIACERGKEICFKIEAEIEKSALEQRQKKYDMTTQRGRLLAAIEGCIVNAEEFGESEVYFQARFGKDSNCDGKWEYFCRGGMMLKTPSSEILEGVFFYS